MFYFQLKIFLALLCFPKTDLVAPRIMGGRQSMQEEFPYMVALFLPSLKKTALSGSGHFKCGGVLLNKNTILTAAHCFFRGKYLYLRNPLVAAAGCTNIAPFDETTQFRYDLTGFVYKGYKSSSLLHDIALLKVDDPFEMNEIIQPLNMRIKDVAKRTICSCQGWGYFGSVKHSFSPKLRTVELEVVSDDKCKKNYAFGGVLIGDNHICAAASSKGSCYGDSGGPLVCHNQIAGIVAFGKACTSDRYPGVYTKVASYMDFIHSPENHTYNEANFIIPLPLSSLMCLITTIWMIK